MIYSASCQLTGRKNHSLTNLILDRNQSLVEYKAMGVLGIDQFRFQTNLLHYRGVFKREDGFSNYGEYLKNTFAKEGLPFVVGEAIAAGPDQLLNWSRRIVEADEMILSGKPLSPEVITTILNGVTQALVQFGSIAMSDQSWAQENPTLDHTDLANRRGVAGADWFTWEGERKEEFRRRLASGPNSIESSARILREMKAIELTGDPILAAGAALSTMQTLVKMSQSHLSTSSTPDA